jgi:Endomembrane protein 70
VRVGVSCASLTQSSWHAVEVNSLVSFDTELPYEYYSLPFCKPKSGVMKSTSSVNPGTILSGLRMYNSPYEFKIDVRRLRRSSPVLIVCTRA